MAGQRYAQIFFRRMSWSSVAKRGAWARTLAAGIRNAEAKALASCSACCPWGGRVTVKGEMASSCPESKRACSARFQGIEKTKGLSCLHIEKASTSAASIASE